MGVDGGMGGCRCLGHLFGLSNHGLVQNRVFESGGEVSVLEVVTGFVFSDGHSHTFGGNTFVSIGFVIFSADQFVGTVSAKMSTVVGANGSASGVVQNSNFFALGFAGVFVGSSISSADWVAVVRTPTFVDRVVIQALSFVCNGDPFASGLTGVLVRVSVGSTDWKGDISASVTVGERPA